ncbi:hypothetical protein, partial [Thiolapillus sp.]|uniref:hypothetical protein n=1 Tax=Thiolapillus sp. TaxID=2017437 RepID=UPI003AF92AB2
MVDQTNWMGVPSGALFQCLSLSSFFAENVDRELGALLLHICRMTLQFLLSFHTAACSTGVNIV